MQQEARKIIIKNPPVYPWIVVAVIIIPALILEFIDELPSNVSGMLNIPERLPDIYYILGVLSLFAGMVLVIYWARKYWGKLYPRMIYFDQEGLTVKVIGRKDNYNILKRTLHIKQKMNKLTLMVNGSPVAKIYRSSVATPESWEEVLAYFDLKQNA